MEPRHLKKNELEYELAIRGVFNVSTYNSQASALQYWLAREENGLAEAPADSSKVFTAQSEINVCNLIFDDIAQSLREAQIGDVPWNRCLSRLNHLNLRLDRIRPSNKSEEDGLDEILNCTYDALLRIEVQTNLNQGAAALPRYSTGNMHNVREGKLVPLEKNIKYQLPKGPHKQSEDDFNNSADSLSNTKQSSMSQANISAKSNNNLGNILNPNPKILISSTNPQNKHSTASALMQVSQAQENVNIANESMIELNDLSAEERANIRKEIAEIMNPNASQFHPNFENINPQYPPTSPRPLPRHAIPNRTQKVNLQIENPNSRAVNQQQMLSQNSVPSFHPQAVQYQTAPFYLNECYQTENVQREVNNNPPENNRYSGNQVLANDYYTRRQQPSQILYLGNNINSNDRRVSIEHPVGRQQPQPQNLYSTSNNGVNHNAMPQALNQLGIGESQAPLQNAHLGRPNPLNFRKSVPIHQWRLTYSGEKNTLHLYDFLAQLTLYQRAERVTDEELFVSFVHLLSGRAKHWYQSVYEYFRTWPEVVVALKKEFLPANYDYMLLSDISNRMMKSDESFAEYVNHMQSLFKCLSIPITEEHKLFLVQKNLLPRFAVSVAPLQINNLQQLSEACRRIDGVVNRQQLPMPFLEQPSYSRSNSRNFERYRQVNEIENNAQYPYEPELCGINYQNTANGQASASQYGGRVKCWNCQTIGHSYQECKERKQKIFCYKCGAPDVITPHCNKCSGNVQRNPVNQRAIPDSNENRPQ